MSKLFRLGWSDLVRGLIVTILASGLGALMEALQAGAIDWRNVAIVALSAAVGYIIKNLLTDTEGKFVGKYQL
jgi:hypothetical protein